MGPGNRSSARRSSRTTLSARSNGQSRSTRPWSGRTSTRAGKGGCSEAVEAIAVDGEHLGRSRGGPSSKIPLVVDGRVLPMSVVLTAGQHGDHPQLLPLLDQISVHRDGPAPDPAGGGDRGQGILPPLDPAGDAGPRGALHQSREDRPRHPPPGQRLCRRTADGGRPPSGTGTSGGTSSNAASPGSSGSATWPPRYAKRAGYYAAELAIAALVLWLR
jgi:hypothetical protein